MPRVMSEDDAQSLLAPWREQIDACDEKLVRLLNERARAVIEIGRIKRDHDLPIYVSDRERQVLDRVLAHNDGPLSDACLRAIWQEMMSGSIALERAVKVGFLGPTGSFSHLAARRKFGASVVYEAQESIADVFDRVARGHVDLGLVPIENTAIGGIGETLDSLLDTPVRIVAEVLINIHHNVLTRGGEGEVAKVYSKPEVFSQCARWLNQNYRGVHRVPVASSARAAEMAAGEAGAAAIGSTLAAEIYGLHVRFANVEDNPDNVTRFFVISRRSAEPSGDDKTAVMFAAQHKTGALAAVLDVFAEHGLDLTHIDKRPNRTVNWEYYFFVDFLGHESDPRVSGALRDVGQRCMQLRVLGSFPRAREVLDELPAAGAAATDASD